MFFGDSDLHNKHLPKHVLVVNFSCVDGKVKIDPRLVAVKNLHGRSVDAEDVLD